MSGLLVLTTGALLMTAPTSVSATAISAADSSIKGIIEPKSVKLSKKAVTLTRKGRTTSLKAKVEPKNATVQLINWSSSDENVAQVDRDGVVTAIGGGTATVKGTVAGREAIYGETTVTVRGAANIPVTDINLISVINDTLELGLTEEFTINAEVLPRDASNQTIEYSSSDETIAKVDSKGVITGISSGQTTIYVTPQDETNREALKEIKVEVSKYKLIEVTSLSLSKDKLTLTRAGRTANLSATVAPKNATIQSVNWSSSDENVAIVNDDGRVTAIGGGTATITATSAANKEISQSSVVTVRGAVNVPVTELELDVDLMETLKLARAETFTVNAHVLPSNATDQGINFHSSDEDVVVVDSQGVITGVAPGKAFIHVLPNDETNREAQKTIAVEVIADKLIEPTNVKLSKEAVTLTRKGRTTNLSATVEPANSDIQLITWSSSDENVATVDGYGRVTAIGGGTATITAAVAGREEVYSTSIITVRGAVNVPVTDVVFNNEEITGIELAVKQKFTIEAAVAPSNATNQKINYVSSDESVAKVNSKGVVTAVNPGKVIIYVLPEDETNRDAQKEVALEVFIY
ncbi:Ig-like domain-containing protein [Vagococcus salmoninarum]|uniref:Ig-like domain-containing protein n=1 Tax=Vagococcus salmoninarum TaxID=2739 RepID=UPI0028D69289|nr:Ig-like domain-containing protein [Vagococcus salmoninarum]